MADDSLVSPFSGNGCNHKQVIEWVGGSESTCGISRCFRRRSKNGSGLERKENSQQAEIISLRSFFGFVPYSCGLEASSSAPLTLSIKKPFPP